MKVTLVHIGGGGQLTSQEWDDVILVYSEKGKTVVVRADGLHYETVGHIALEAVDGRSHNHVRSADGSSADDSQGKV